MNNDEILPGGISGPRRKTEQPPEIAAANAEAARLAQELGFSSSSRRRRLDPSPASNTSTPVIQKRNQGLSGIFSRSKVSSTAEDQSNTYSAVAPDGTTNGALLRESSPTNEGNPSSSTSPLPHPYSPPTDVDYGLGYYDDNVSIRTDNFSVRSEDIHTYDEYGNRAPYREGPYVFHHDDYGHRYKNRWCKYHHMLHFFKLLFTLSPCVTLWSFAKL